MYYHFFHNSKKKRKQKSNSNIEVPIKKRHASPKNTNILLLFTISSSHLREFITISYQLIFKSYSNFTSCPKNVFS